jgi:hypothetical protein
MVVKGAKDRRTYSDLEIHKLLCECAHLVIEAEPVFPDLQGREDEVALALLLAVHDDLVVGAGHLIIDIEGTTCLDLRTPNSISINFVDGQVMLPGSIYGEGSEACVQRSRMRPSRPSPRRRCRSKPSR